MSESLAKVGLVGEGARLYGEDGAVRWELEGYRMPCAAFAPDGRHLFVASNSGVVVVDVRRGETIGTLRGQQSIYDLACDAGVLVSAGDGLLVWSLAALERFGFQHPDAPAIDRSSGGNDDDDDRYDSIRE